MKASDKKAWIEALRSGKYTQTHGALRVHATAHGPGGHCCLGVLCDILESEGWSGWDPSGIAKHARGVITPDPEWLKSRLGIEEDEVHRIIEMWRYNDDGETFDQIAAHIEAEIPVTE